MSWVAAADATRHLARRHSASLPTAQTASLGMDVSLRPLHTAFATMAPHAGGLSAGQCRSSKGPSCLELATDAHRSTEGHDLRLWLHGWPPQVFVVFGGLIGYSSDDINKFLWMVRIGAGVYPDIKVNMHQLWSALHTWRKPGCDAWYCCRSATCHSHKAHTCMTHPGFCQTRPSELKSEA